MKKEEKVAALSQLMVQGVLTADELGRLIAALEPTGVSPETEKTPAQKTYEDYITNVVATSFKSPSQVKFPPFDPSMVKNGTIKLDLKEQNIRYIQTYVDAPNSYGAMLREEIIIGIDNNFTPLFWAQHIQLSPILGKTKGWMTMSKKRG
ncbi:MAG: hypothetical protein E7546_01915 [Ruminococcaceae bacterium]|nr:hypothetical protein [Oscillospiraceae bacterium]